MSSTSAPSISSTQVSQRLLSARGWMWLIGLGFTFILLFSKYFDRLLRVITQTRGNVDFLEVLGRLATFNLDPDWAHVLIIPLFSIYHIQLNRQRIAVTPHRVYLPGLLIMLIGIFSYVFWIFPGRNDMFQGFSMVLTLFGLVLFVLGPAMMRILWFPIAFLVFSVKISDMIWDQVAWKLQLVAAQTSAVVLSILGVLLDMEASVRGSTIDLWVSGKLLDPPLNVAEACSGLRMLMAFIALGVAIAFLSPRPWWQRLIMVGASVPIAVAVNVGRVTTLGLLYAKVDPSLATGDVHMFIGMLMLVPAAGLCWLLGWILNHIVIEDPEARAEKAARQADRADAAGRIPAAKGKLLGTTALLGVVFSVITALGYALGWGIFKPDVIFGQWLRPTGASLLLACCVALLIGGLFLTKRLLQPERKPAFGTPVRSLTLAGAMMLSSLFCISSMVEATELVLIKQELPLRAKLRELPREIGTWEARAKDPTLEPDVVKTLGTESYLIRGYQDASRGPTSKGNSALLHVAYYTGTPDTVPHVPDRCFVAGGIQAVNTGETTLGLTGEQYYQDTTGLRAESGFARELKVPDPHIPGREITATLFTFQNPRRPDQTQNVIYFFVANGKFLSSPNEVRAQGLTPWDRYSYYCKVEVQMSDATDPEMAVQRTSDFLSVVMPELMAILPDWVLVHQQEVTKKVD